MLAAALAVGGWSVGAQAAEDQAPSPAGQGVSEASQPTPAAGRARDGMEKPPGVRDELAVFDRAEPMPEVYSKVGVAEHRGDALPLDLRFTDDAGKEVRLGDYLKAGKPIILNLGYYSCPMLCDRVMNGMNQAMKEMAWMPGDEYQVISVSIDPSENARLAASKKKNYIEELGYEAASHGWHFLTGDQDNITALAQAVGFNYEWVQRQMEFAHPAVIIIITPDGKISRYLYGVAFPGSTLRLSLVEASEGKIGSALDQLILTCFHYDPQAGSYAVSAMKLMRLGGGLTVLLVMVVISTLLTKEFMRRQRETVKHEASASM